jgi:hypothetical protein
MTAEIRAQVEGYKTYFFHRNDAGGRAYFIPQPDLGLMNTVLKEADPVRDADIQEPIMWPLKMGSAYDGALTYIHKVKDGRDLYFFANSTEKPIDTKVVVRGNKELWIWNPHAGERRPAESTHGQRRGNHHRSAASAACFFPLLHTGAQDYRRLTSQIFSR